MFDLPSISVSLVLHVVVLAVIVAWSASGEKKPRVEYNFLKANVVVQEPPKLVEKPVKAPPAPKTPKKKVPDRKPAVKNKPPAPKPVKPKPAQQPQQQQRAAVNPSKKPDPVVEPKKPEKALPEIDLPVISEWSSVLAEEQAELEAAAQALDAQAEAQTRALEIKAYYVELIRNRIGNYWSRPLSARNGMVVVLSVRLLPDGTVHRVSVEQSSGSASFDRSCLQAVQKAGTLPVPEERDVFNRFFKKFSIQFRPEDLQQ